MGGRTHDWSATVMETEVERIIVRMTGDASEYQRAVKQVIASTQGMATQVQQHTTRAEGFMASFGQGAILAAGGITAAIAVGAAAVGAFRGAFGEWTEAERMGIRLEETSRAN